MAHFVNELRHRLRGIGAAADLDHFRRALEFVRQRFDLARERGREHQRLALLRQRFHDPPDRREEAHVEHAVRFIEDEKFEPGEIRVALPHQIDQPARRRDDQFDPGAQRLDLRTLAHAAEDRRHAQRQMFRVGAHVFLDLHHQLARRRDHQRAHPAPLPFAEPSSEMMQNRQDEGRRLAGAGLRDADDIAPGENLRNGGRLDRRRLGVTSFLDGFEDAVVETERTKGHEPGTIVEAGGITRGFFRASTGGTGAVPSRMMS